MLPVGSGSKAIPPQFANLPPLPGIERRNVHYLEASYSGNPVSKPLLSIASAEAELKQVYPDGYIEYSSLDVAGEAEMFNRVGGHSKSFFSDWFAIRDFKNDGYVRLNQFLREGTSLGIGEEKAVQQLTRALMYQSLLQDADFEENVVYRSEVKSEAEASVFKQGRGYVTPSFMSATEEEDVAARILGEPEDLPEGLVLVRYEIDRDSCLSGPNITRLLQDGEDDVIFLPGTSFVVTSVERDDREVRVKMATMEVDREAWGARLASLATIS